MASWPTQGPDRLGLDRRRVWDERSPQERFMAERLGAAPQAEGLPAPSRSPTPSWSTPRHSAEPEPVHSGHRRTTVIVHWGPGASQATISSHERALERLCKCDVRRVVGAEVLTQLPHDPGDRKPGRSMPNRCQTSIIRSAAPTSRSPRSTRP